MTEYDNGVKVTGITARDVVQYTMPEIKKELKQLSIELPLAIILASGAVYGITQVKNIVIDYFKYPTTEQIQLERPATIDNLVK